MAENGGTVFLVSSDVFTFSGLLNAADGIPGVRAWAITNTSLLAEVLPSKTPSLLFLMSSSPAYPQTGG